MFQFSDLNKSIFKLIFDLHSADGAIEKQELLYLQEVASNLALKPEDVMQISKNPTEYIFVPPTDEQGRMMVLYYLLFGMRVDGVIHEKEEKYIYNIAIKQLGFNELMIADFIAFMKQYSNDRLPEDGLIKIIKKYQN